MYCNILYNNNKVILKTELALYLRTKNVQGFFNTFIKENKNQQERVTKKTTDEEKDIEISTKKFVEDLINIKNAMIAENPDNASILNDLVVLVLQKLSIDLDESQSGSILIQQEDTIEELKNITEVKDNNTSDVNKATDDIYGKDAYNIVQSMKIEFKDAITSASYWDPILGTVVLKSDIILNKNFKALKDKWYKIIVKYLQSQDADKFKHLALSMYNEDGSFIGSSYFITLRTFYSYIKLDPLFKEIIYKNQSDAVNLVTRISKLNTYNILVLTLMNNKDFKDAVDSDNFFNSNRRTLLYTVLYEADHLSIYFNKVKLLVKDLKLEELKIGNKTVQELLNEIEQTDITLLNATNAYTYLKHFDTLLSDLYEDAFSITKELKGLEIDDDFKYKYHKETSHEKNGYLLAEVVQSEKFTANLTKAVFEQIRIYDYKYGNYLNRRLDSTAFIVAAHNLINDIIYNNITWNSEAMTAGTRRRKILNDLVLNVLSLHRNPEENFLKILEYLFDTNSNKEPFWVNIVSKKNLTDYDLDILYSVYHAVYNKHNEYSLISQEMNTIKSSTGLVLKLVQEISGYVDRNTNMDYMETYYDLDSGKVIIKVKKKYFNNPRLYKLLNKINRMVNTRKPELSLKLSEEYDFLIKSTLSEGEQYSITLKSGDIITLMVPNKLGGKILTNDNSISFLNTEFFKKLNLIDLIEFKNKLGKDAKKNFFLLNEDELKLFYVLQFIEVLLGINFISNPSWNLEVLLIYKSIYLPDTDKIVGNYYIQPLLLLAMRAAYGTNNIAKAGDGTLYNYLLENDNDGVFANHNANGAKSKLFITKYNNVKYVIAGYNDRVLELWVDAISMLNGEASKATTKDKLGNSIPNNGINKLGSIIHHYLLKLKDTNVGSLLFVLDYTNIKGTYHDLEVTAMNKETKSVKSFSSGELFYHSIFNKFWGAYVGDTSDKGNSVIIQPTTYADKTTFINYRISTIFNNKDLMKSTNIEKDVVNLYLETIGTMYKNIWEETKEKLMNIAKVYNDINHTNLSYKQVLQSINQFELLNYAKKTKVLQNYNKEHNTTINYTELEKIIPAELLQVLISEAKISIELEKDYRVIKKNGKKVTTVNEELEYYATKLYRDKESLSEFLQKLQINFVENLLNANATFLVINYNDNYHYYTNASIPSKAKSNNPILLIILKFYKEDATGRMLFIKDWVDEKTGKLIIAKQNNINIIGMNNTLDLNTKVILNPLLLKFFYVEGLLSNNLRMSLTGSEINHPDKSINLYNRIKGLSYKEGSKMIKDNVLLSEDQDISEKDYNLVQERLKNTSTVGDLYYEDDLSEDSIVENLLHKIYDQSLVEISNVSQGTQFKRNVSITATLLYCEQKTYDGITERLQCAAIEDEEANVWNYRGEHEKPLDSADGSAQITMMEAILENNALGSQAVGLIRKPIIHSYDSNNGTAFLAKFAVDTITNETMRMSRNSHTNLHNLFKKMTNLLWKGDVDLTESIMLGLVGNEDTKENTMKLWFESTLLGNTLLKDSEGNITYLRDNLLLYKDAYGTVKNITGFNKTVLKNGLVLYYTKENTYIDDNTTTTTKKVYHVFYDIKNDEGKVIKSNHITFDTYQLAADFIEKTPTAHTINSIYELHTALGGINCVNKDGTNSEFNNYVVVNFMNNVGHIKKGFNFKLDIINLNTYVLPMKKYFINYAFNKTSVKEGIKNINPESSWFDDSELNYFEIDSDGLGMLMNADHDIINSELTEFSLVIAATAAYGYTLENTTEIFKGLAEAAFLASKKALIAVNNFLNTNFTEEEKLLAKSDLYDAIGKIILVNHQIKDNENLLSIIMLAITDIFYKSKNHILDKVKIPFSDSNIYSSFISTLASTINAESIKRKHPGSGCVMAPAYNMILYFEFAHPDSGIMGKFLAEDVLKMAKKDYAIELTELLRAHPNYNKSTDTIVLDDVSYELTLFGEYLSIPELLEIILKLKIENTSIYATDFLDTYNIEKNLILKFLLKKQAESKVYTDKSWYMPSDIVDVLDESDNLLYTVDLNSLDTYYKFKDGYLQTEFDNNVKITPNYALKEFIITLKENPNQKVIIKPEIIGNKITKLYEAHLHLGSFSEEQKKRLTNSILEILPEHTKIKLWIDSEEKPIEDNITTNKIKIINIKSYQANYNGSVNTIYDIEKGNNENNTKYKYRVNITKPHNLRPSLIRWQYLEQDEHGIELKDASGNLLPPVYKNIFDLDIIKKSYTESYNKPEDYRKQILDILHNLHDRFFIDSNGIKQTILEDSLENEAAELIMSNLHKEKFNIGNESLAEILNTGEKYFEKKYNNLNAPANFFYDLAFLKDDGNHTLISLDLNISGDYILEVDFEKELLSTNSLDEIIYSKKNRDLFKVGKWINVNSEEYKWIDGKVYDRNNNLVKDQSLFRLKDKDNPLSLQLKLIYVKRYKMLGKAVTKHNKVYHKETTIYQLATIDIFKKALESENLSIEQLNIDANKQRSSIINKIYSSDRFKMAQISNYKVFTTKRLNLVKQSLTFILGNNYISEDVKTLLREQLKTITTADNLNSDDNLKLLFSYKKKDENKFNNLLNTYLTKQQVQLFKKITDTKELEKFLKKYIQKEAYSKIAEENDKNYKKLKKEFLKKEAHKKWISFLDSLNYISSRIPALTLQSFMSMKLIGWTGTSDNTAYVSHFQTYLQGSDYDIDKAYIMSQSYDTDATYIGWSSLFDFTSLKTLETSKSLPMPEKVNIIYSDSGLNITDEVEQLIPYLDNSGKITGNSKERTKALQHITKLIRKIDNNKTIVNNENGLKTISTVFYVNPKDKRFIELLKILNEHEFYPIPPNVSEQAYKNIASANIYTVAHDIRNRDLAYTAITMSKLQKSANKSPKGLQTAKLNMLNPLTKYIMLYLNLVGKDVIGIAANGEKIWFNSYYFWNLILKYGSKDDIKKLRFKHNFKRIAGRASGLGNIKNKTIDHLPDLNTRDLQIKQALEDLLHLEDVDRETYIYVDLLISQLLSAATDNAKELILYRINAGTNFAKMYIYTIMMGFDIDDIVAFMTSPAAEFIDKLSAPNIFNNEATNNVLSAINIAAGYINAKNFLHGNITVKNEEEETSSSISKSSKIIKAIKPILDKSDLTLVYKLLEIKADSEGNYPEFANVSLYMLAYILLLATNNADNSDIRDLVYVQDSEINNYLGYCQYIKENIKKVLLTYPSYFDYMADIDEFNRINTLAQEITSISSAYLGLNLGLPTDELGILEVITKMTKLVTSRERTLGIYDGQIYATSNKKTYPELEDLDLYWKVQKSKLKKSKTKEETLKENKTLVIKNILNNNSTLENVEARLDAAHEAGIINNFNLVEYLKNDEYRLKVKDYFGLIMGTFNVFEMMDTLPHYKKILECLKLLVVSNNTFSSKSRLITELINRTNTQNLTKKLLLNIIQYVDKINIKNFVTTATYVNEDGLVKKCCPNIVLNKPTTVFNKYREKESSLVIDFTTMEGIASFRYWMEEEMLPYWQSFDNPLSSNGFIKNLELVPTGDDLNLIATSVDLLNPNITTISRNKYEEILRGISELDTIYLDNDKNYTISELFLLYNLIVNHNNYGDERLTTIFKSCTTKGIINKYLNYISTLDISTEVLDYDFVDFLINTAPVVSPYREAFVKDRFIKVTDPVRGLILKTKNYKNNSYVENINFVLPKKNENFADMLARLENYMNYDSFTMPNFTKLLFLIKTIDFDGDYIDLDLDELQDIFENIKNIINQLSINGKILIFKDC